jgi:hypothetical protein
LIRKSGSAIKNFSIKENITKILKRKGTRDKRLYEKNKRTAKLKKKRAEKRKK